MNLSRISWTAGALLGLTAVIAGAMGSHALSTSLTTDLLDAYETAVRFQMFHALLLLVLGTMAHVLPQISLRVAISATIAGVLLFSGSIYLLVLTPIKLGIVTPIGGVLLIVGWGTLLWALWRYKS